MTRIKKLLLAGSMAVVTCCVSLSSSLLNISSLFAKVKVNAETATTSEDSNFNNTLDNSSTVNGKIISVSNIPNSAQKGTKNPVYIPKKVMVSTLNSSGTISNAELKDPTRIIIKNPYGVSLLKEDGTPVDDASTGNTIELKDSTNSEYPNHYEFTPAQIGTYTVQYAVQDTNGVWTSSNIYGIEVSAEKFSIEFVSNDSIVMPNTIDTGLSEEERTVDIALPLFYNGKGELIKKFVLETNENNFRYVAEYVTLKNVFLDKYNSPVEIKEGITNPDAAGKNVYETYSTYQIKKISETNFDASEYPYSVAINTKVSNQKANGNNADITSSDYTLTLDKYNLDENETYNYVDCPYHFVAGVGLNSIDYRLFETDSEDNTSNVDMPLSSINKSLNGSNTHRKGDIDLGVSVSSNIRSSATSIGKKTYLPTVNSVNKNANRNALPAYYFYKIAFVDSDNKDKLIYDDSSKLVMGVDDGGVYFIPKVQGKFNIYYNAVDFYFNYNAVDGSFDANIQASANKGHTDNLAEDYDYDVNVMDRTSPELYLVDTYNFDELSDETNGDKLKESLKENDLSYTIPTKYAISKDIDNLTKIKIPAIYTEDNFKNFNDLRIFKTISSTNGFVFDNETLNNFSIKVQDGSSGNSTSFSSTLTGLNIDEIIQFDIDNSTANVPENYYYKNGNFYDKTDAVDATETEISSNKLMIVTEGSDSRIVVYKIVEKEDGTTEKVEDKDKIVPGEFFLSDDNSKIRKTTKSIDSDIVKKLKTSLTATLTIDPRLFAPGDYTIEFRVTDGVYANNTGDKFTFTLVEGGEKIDTEAPEVKFSTATTLGNVGDDEEISIAKPKITDDVDNRIYVKYYVEVNGEYHEIKLDENNKLTFNTGDNVTLKAGGEDTIYNLAVKSPDKKFNVIALAYDDFAEYGFYPNNTATAEIPAFDLELLKEKDEGKMGAHIGYAVYPISIKYIKDTLAPIIYEKTSIPGVLETNFDQGDRVLINGIKYYDNTQNAYIKSIKVVDSKGNVCNYNTLSINDFKTYIEENAKTEQEKKELEKEIKGKLSSYVNKITTPPTITGLDTTEYVYEHYFPGISFVATEAENYTITYEVCDTGTNNVTVFSFVTVKAGDTEAPVIDGVTNATNTLELGETYYIGDIKATDNSTSDVQLTWEVKGAKTGYKNNWFNKLDDGTFVFTPQEVDVYTITVTAVDDRFNSSSKSFVVTVKDTSKPTIQLESQFPAATYGDYSRTEIIIDEKVGDGQTDNNGVAIKWEDAKLPSVNLPGFSAKDKYQEMGFSSLGADGLLTIKTPDDNVSYTIDKEGNVTGGQNEIKLRRNSENGVYYFTFVPTKRGHYQAVYSAEDRNGNKSEKNEVIDIRIGDTEVPEIKLTESLISRLDKGFVVNENNELVINPQARIEGDPNYTIADLYVYDNHGFNKREEGTDENKYNYVNVSISVTNENNSTIKQQDSKNDGLVRYKFDTAGTYTITFTVTDECGNTGTYNRKFVVSKDKPSTLDTTKIVGIVLIVVSVLILGGVVIYFAKGTKFLPKRKKKGADKKEKNETPTKSQE